MVRKAWGLGAGVCAAVAMAAALYVIPGCSSKPGDLKSLATGAMKSLTVLDKPSPAPQVAFADAAGKPHMLGEFKGKVVVLNLWATWCGPCVEEMPTLAKLQTEFAGQPVVVIPVSVDRDEDRANAEDFIAKRPPLPFYVEPTYALPGAFNPPVAGLPTTVLIDPAGNVRATVSGGADWSSDEARRVVQALEKPG